MGAVCVSLNMLLLSPQLSSSQFYSPARTKPRIYIILYSQYSKLVSSFLPLDISSLCQSKCTLNTDITENFPILDRAGRLVCVWVGMRRASQSIPQLKPSFYFTYPRSTHTHTRSTELDTPSRLSSVYAFIL